jgi:hypothetical protein
MTPEEKQNRLYRLKRYRIVLEATYRKNHAMAEALEVSLMALDDRIELVESGVSK